MKKVFASSYLLFLFTLYCYPQSEDKPLDLFPISPTAYEFLKYDQFPVSTYTGVPNISVPIYSFSVDNIEFPLTLQYHAGGIRVDQEASHVGLGWSMNIGTIVQVVNDEDDYGIASDGGDIIKMIPDWHGIPIITSYPWRYKYPTNVDGSGWINPYPLETTQKYHTAKIATDFYLPINGNFATRQEQLFISNKRYDSEPDVFKASFLGHSLTFIRDISNIYQANDIKILDKKGYKVRRYTENGQTGWEIIVPDGNKFYFMISERNKISNSNNGEFGSIGEFGFVGYSGDGDITFYLTKILTTNNKTITLDYISLPEVLSFPRISQHLIKPILIGSFNEDGVGNHNGTFGHGYFGEGNPFGSQSQLIKQSRTRFLGSKKLPSVINFPEGSVEFAYSDRLDSNDKKLDQVIIKDYQNNQIQQVNFNYNYFIATNNGNQLVYNNLNSSLLNTHRLKLVNVDFGGEKKYSFTYDSTNLPAKLSFARDFWGYYNGRTNDNSLIPNPARYSLTQFNPNSNNKSSRLSYAKAGILKEITYPTGGKSVYEYELNEFDNYWVPDYSSTNNVVTKGLGLRVKTITKFSNSNIQRKVKYYYSGGKASLPIDYYSKFNIKWFVWNGSIYNGYYSYKIHEFKPRGYFTPNIFGSQSGIGYNQVIVEEVDYSNESKTNGKTILNYHNNQDIVGTTLSSSGYLNITLPAMKDTSNPDNGSLISREIYNEQGDTLLIEKFEYNTHESEVYYGAKLAGYGYLLSQFLQGGGVTNQLRSRNIIGFYPIFGSHSLKKSIHKKEFFENGSISLNTYFVYNDNDILISTKEISDSSNQIYKKDIILSTNITHINKNLLTLPSSISNFEYGKLVSKEEYAYVENNGITVLSLVKKLYRGNLQNYKKTFFDLYDSKGNLLEFHNENDIKTSIIWGYNNQHPIAKIVNATYTEAIALLSVSTETLQNLDGQNLRNKLNLIRQGLPDAQVTTYTFDPLIGVTSITDPRGNTTFFEYDVYNHLKYIKDRDGNILSKSEYNFKNQN